jgi:glycosyltransferase involved in cell wall biosynthesis
LKSTRLIQLSAVRKFLKTHKPKVLLGEYLDGSLPFLPLSRELGIRFFVHGHGYDLSQKCNDEAVWESYRQYRDAEGVITVNRIQRNRLLSLGLDPRKVHVVPCGVDVPDHTPSRPLSESVHCLAVGRLVPKKAPLLLLEAFRRAAKDFPNLRLEYVGDGPMLPEIKSFVSRLGLEDKVRLRGALPNQEVKALMQKSSLFQQHSITDPVTGDEEGMPVAILEAMGAGLPVVSTLHAGIPDAVIDGETGFLGPEGDVQTMSEYILQLSTNPLLREKMGFEGWRLAKEKFSSVIEVMKLRKIFGLSEGCRGGLT